MNKKEFLKELENRLSILDETERNDIIQEYKDTIDEKIKHGQTEKDAIKDFGHMDELVSEILKAYKINPNYNAKEGDFHESVKEVGQNLDSMIKKGAKKLSEFSNKIVNDFKDNGTELSSELIFELLLKAVLLLCILAIASIPFQIIKFLGVGILNVLFSPLDIIGIIFWKLIVNILYLLTCIFITIAMFRKYFKSEKKSTKKSKKKDPKRTEEPIVEDVVVKEKSNVLNVFEIIIKVIGILMLFPLVCASIGIAIAVVINGYLIIKGVSLVGILILLLGIFGFLSYFENLLCNLMFYRKKIHFYPLIITISLIIVGGLISIDEVMSLNYYDKLPTHSFVEQRKLIHTNTDTALKITGEYDHKNIYEKNTLPDDKLEVEIIYYSDFVDITYINQNYGCDNHTCQEIILDKRPVKFNTNRFYKIKNLVLDDLKNDSIYNYSLFGNVTVNIYGNHNTISKVK